MLTVSDGGGYAVSVPPTSDGSISGGTFTVDPDQIPTLIAGIDTALDKLRHIKTQVRQLAIISPPGGDPFSKDAVEQMGLVASGGPSALEGAHDEYYASLDRVRGDLQTALAVYSGVESANASGYKA